MALAQGDTAPNFKFTSQDGQTKSFYDIDGTRVVFFFPKAFTPGCTAQACSIRDTYDDLRHEGVTEVFGISIDNEDNLSKFKEQYDLDYILIPDDGKISKKYDVFNNFLIKKVSGRVTYTVNSQNIITNVINSGIMGNKADRKLDHHGEDIVDFLQL